MAVATQIQQERETKQARVREFMDARGLDGLVLTRQDNFAWYTGGKDNHVANSTEGGAASILITGDAQYVLTENIEAPRIAEEELAGRDFALVEYPWYEKTLDEEIARLMPGKKLGSDTPIAGAELLAAEIAPLRWSLTPVEIARYRWLGAACSEAMSELCHSLQPGIMEYEIAGELMGSVQSLGIIPMVALVATDDRIFKYRHPIPTDKELEQHAMVVLCGKKWGLICSLTRMVYFGKLPKELRWKHDSAARIDAGFIARTVPGAKAATIFEQAVRDYQNEGYGDEWKLHHQGGATGYALRDYRATPYSTEQVLPNQAFAWNPSITGAKSEDTIIATPEGTEVISEAIDWPMIEVPIDNRVIARPDVLVK